MKRIHLVCNAHLDPVWLWQIEEGIAETLATFRVAADFCDEYGGFVFCHNEAMLYQWVEEYEPELFRRIQRLVKEGKWHIMGGWYLQPDCNMPSGESFVRQILCGKTYFKEKFGAEPTCCINFDAFGHTRGLVEILLKAGYDSYLFCRPEPDMLPLPGEDFNWVGFGGGRIACHRAYNSYESHRGEADLKIKGFLKENSAADPGLVLWGIGDHGGGPSRVDYEKIEALNASSSDFELIQSTPEAYFSELDKDSLPDYDGLLNPRYIGCYTTQIRVKQLHRKLENELYLTEKMAAHASLCGLMEYPRESIEAAMKDLLLMEFHDILPGSAIQPVEEYAVSLAGHGLQELSRVRNRAFLSLSSGQKKAENGSIPILIYNPHPYEVEQIFECEYQLPDQNKNRDLFAMPRVYRDGVEIDSQPEHEDSNFNVDWRKRSVFRARLNPGAMNRFDVRIELVPNPEPASSAADGGTLVFDNGSMRAVINTVSGTLDSYAVDGKEYITAGGFRALAIRDDENSWAFKERELRSVKGVFEPMSPERAAEFSGIIDGSCPASVRVIENGAVRAVVEAVLEYAHSQICIRYYIPKKGTEIKVKVKVYWNEKMTMLKLSVPTPLRDGFVGQTAYGSEKLLTNGEEMVSQKWNILTGEAGALSVINDGTYGSDCKDGELRITCLRSPGYSAGKSDFSVRKPYIMEQDRFSPFIDQGERDFEFTVNASDEKTRFEMIEREALAAAEKPVVLSFFPTGDGNAVKPFALLDNRVITVAAFKAAQSGRGYVIRLFNPTTQRRETTLSIPAAGIELRAELDKFEFKSYLFDPQEGKIHETDLLERQI